MREIRVGMWIRVGLLVLAGATVAIAPAIAAAPMPANGNTNGSAAGAVHVAAADLPADSAMAMHLLMIDGYLRAGGDLWAAGDAKGAAPHFARPKAAIYGAIEGKLGDYGILPFGQTLAQPVTLAAAGAKSAEVMAAVRDAQGMTVGALDKVEDRLSAGDTARAVVAVLQTAAREYANSMRGGRFVDLDKYQDARGFILAARDFLSRQTKLRRQNTRAYIGMRAPVDRLARTFIKSEPPKAPVLDAAAMNAAVAKVGTAAGNFGSGSGGTN